MILYGYNVLIFAGILLVGAVVVGSTVRHEGREVFGVLAIIIGTLAIVLFWSGIEDLIKRH